MYDTSICWTINQNPHCRYLWLLIMTAANFFLTPINTALDHSNKWLTLVWTLRTAQNCCSFSLKGCPRWVAWFRIWLGCWVRPKTHCRYYVSRLVLWAPWDPPGRAEGCGLSYPNTILPNWVSGRKWMDSLNNFWLGVKTGWTQCMLSYYCWPTPLILNWGYAHPPPYIVHSHLLLPLCLWSKISLILEVTYCLWD